MGTFKFEILPNITLYSDVVNVLYLKKIVVKFFGKASKEFLVSFQIQFKFHGNE